MNDDIIHCPPLQLGSQFSKGGDSVILSGKVFEIGLYPDRNFEITTDEMDAAIAEFSPIANDLEHSRLRDVLGNSLGELRRLWRIGKDVFGELAVPKWLADLTGNALKVSLAFNRSKRVVGNALTISPRVTDAEVVAAFSGQQTNFSFREWVQNLFRGAPSEVARGVERQALALRFAEDAVRAKKFLPVDLPYLRKAFEAAVIADSLGKFADVEGECCDALREMVEQRPAHELAEDLLSASSISHVAAGDGISEERKSELLGKTDLGREVKKAKKNRAS